MHSKLNGNESPAQTGDINRREFMAAVGTVGVLGASRSLLPSWMPRMAFRSPQQMAQADLSNSGGSSSNSPGDVLLCIFLRGGIDGLSAVVPFGEGGNYYDARPTLSVAEPGERSGALDLNGYFGLHPALAPIRDIYSEGDLLVIHAAGLTDPSRSHFDAMRFMELGTPGSKSTTSGWLARHLQSAAWQNLSPFRAVGMGAMVPESLRGPISPLSLRSIADFHFKGRQDELRQLQQSLSSIYSIDTPTDQANPSALSQQAGMVFDTIETLQGLDATNYRPNNGVTYPDSEFGLGLQQVAQLAKADVGLEVACVDLGGWDTHESQGTLDGYFNQLLTELGNGLGAFYADMEGYMSNVTVVTMSEFGRRVQENGSQGTDHGHGNVMFVMGGGAKGGQVYSDWPTLAPEALNDGDLAITTDYRDVLAEVISKRLNNQALAQIFPGHTVTDLGLLEQRV
ncbi:MAG: DUF1501 domain-containing protein [Chloroflexota bacterium]